ncbi:MFS transporter [Streptomyces mirabilis]|jgi:Arabinose efflux permease|uniref:MFS transporter n=1 Tax=Streptomyces mirabilis TaxID=68239 RepID=UPI0033CAB21B
MPSREEPSRWALIALCLGFSLVILDTTMVTVGLPTMETGLGIRGGVAQWIVDAYTLTFAALLLSGGALADRWGARRVYLGGTALFAVGSALCALATCGWMLVAARAVQGVGAAGLMPGSLSLIESSYLDARRQARAVAVWGMVGGFAAAVGPLAGGVLVASFGWRGLFWANLAVAVVTLGLSRCLLREAPTSRRRVDLVGQVILFAALAAVVAGVIELGDGGAEPEWGLLLVVAGVVLAPVFAAVERRRPEPVLELGLLRHRGMRATALVGLALNFGFYGQLFLLTGFLQQVERMSAVQTGVVISGEALGAICGSPYGGWAVNRFSHRAAMLTGLLLGAGGLLAMAAASWERAPGMTVAASFVLGFGIDTAMTAATAFMLRLAPSGRAGVASALLTTARQVGSLLGVALLGVLGDATQQSPRTFALAMLIASLSYLGAAYLARNVHVEFGREGWRTDSVTTPPPLRSQPPT